MKSDFLLAFNEICQERGLPQDTVIEALKTALVSAYRRNTNVSNVQEVSVDIDPRTGEPTIYAEKEVVDSIIDSRTEVLIQDAHSAGFTDAEMGDMVMVDSTPRNFGRIAAQTAKQVILQRVREAEREQLYDDFASREGEIVNGTVQSISGQNITIGLGRTEALLPRSQQVSNERYRPHDKIRVYVLEVRRTNRGPQIYVSRNHRNLLRRLLELEVPEIYNGQVDIKSIAREAGQRSKVAVMALQPGVDPVGACVGMRGVRIQSIVRELNDEKIDVIEWDNDQRNFIAKALSPARVAAVFLEEHPDSGKTAVVIVPDDQLSLAIGREGQNARLAAKLTGWRIDIKSLTEAAQDSLGMLEHEAVDREVIEKPEFLEHVKHVIEKKKANRPVTAEDYLSLSRLVNAVEGKIIASRAAAHDEIRKARAELKKQIAPEAWETDIIEFNLMHRTHNVLVENGVTTVGAALYQLELGDINLLSLNGFGDKALEELKKAAKGYMEELEVRLQERLAAEEAQKAAEAETETEAEELEETVAETIEDLAEEIAEAVTDDSDSDSDSEIIEDAIEEAVEEALEELAKDTDIEVIEEVVEEALEEETAEAAAVEAATAEIVTEVVAEVASEEVAEPEAIVEEVTQPEPVAEVAEVAEETEEDDDVAPIDDLNTSLVQARKKKKEPKKKKKQVVVVRSSGSEYDDDDDDDARNRSNKGKELVFDENAGRVVVKRKRKGSRRRPDWEDYDDYEY